MIEINNLTKTRISPKNIRNFTRKALKALKIKKTISLAFVSSTKMRSLNKTYLGKDKTTDTLSFPNFIQEPRGRLMIKLRTRRIRQLAEKAGGSSKTSEWHFSSTNNFLGEIIISLPQTKKQAKTEKHSLEKEIKILVLHSILHLKGFDHKKLEERRKMEKLEKEMLKILKV